MRPFLAAQLPDALTRWVLCVLVVTSAFPLIAWLLWPVGIALGVVPRVCE